MCPVYFIIHPIHPGFCLPEQTVPFWLWGSHRSSEEEYTLQFLSSYGVCTALVAAVEKPPPCSSAGSCAGRLRDDSNLGTRSVSSHHQSDYQSGELSEQGLEGARLEPRVNSVGEGQQRRSPRGTYWSPRLLHTHTIGLPKARNTRACVYDTESYVEYMRVVFAAVSSRHQSLASVWIGRQDVLFPLPAVPQPRSVRVRRCLWKIAVPVWTTLPPDKPRYRSISQRLSFLLTPRLDTESEDPKFL
ncbi:hypothetical protein Bbelb_420410 [Branchiostoma belcheri]|nr:hypothetical protein Bbelb_420410 [Branchiostoma belcheri]